MHTPKPSGLAVLVDLQQRKEDLSPRPRSQPGALAGRRQEWPRSCLCDSCARKMPVPKRANGCRQAQAAVFAAQLLAERVSRPWRMCTALELGWASTQASQRQD